MTDPLLTVENLKTHYPITEGILQREVGRVKAVDGISFSLERGETLGVVGESGCGKTTMARTLLQLEDPTDGEIRFDGQPLSELAPAARQDYQRRVQLIVQDPDEALNPRMTVRESIAEPLSLHGLDDRDQQMAIIEDLVDRVGLSPEDLDRYPHEFSGGEKQRLAIARALTVDPDLIIADEPTSALDSRIQARILALLARINQEFGVAILMISHDIDVVRQLCEQLLVMYLGQDVEQGPTEQILSDPAHPYTQLLCGSVPAFDATEQTFPQPLTDSIPEPSDPPSGCRFHTRCPAYIPPADVTLGSDVWRSVIGFRFALQTDELPRSIAGRLTETSPPEIRSAFNLPDQLGDPTVETALQRAIEDLTNGDQESAINRLEPFQSRCEHEQPEPYEYNDRVVYCHRYDETADHPLPDV